MLTHVLCRSIKRKPKKSGKDGAKHSSAKNSPAENKQSKKPRNPFNKMDIETEDEVASDTNTAKPDLMTEQPEATNPDQAETKDTVKNITGTSPVHSKRGNKQNNFNNRGRGGPRNNAKRVASEDKASTDNGTNDRASEENSMQVEAGAPQQVVFKGSVPKSFNFGRGRGRGLHNKSPARNYFQRTENSAKDETSSDVQMKN